MKIKSLLGTLALSLGLLASPAAAEKFVVGFQPYDTISYQAIVNAELGLWKKYTPAGTEIEFQPALQGTVVANNMLANKAQVGYMSVMPATILCSKPKQAEIKMVATRGMSKGTRSSWSARTPPNSRATKKSPAGSTARSSPPPRAARPTSTSAVSLKSIT